MPSWRSSLSASGTYLLVARLPKFRVTAELRAYMSLKMPYSFGGRLSKGCDLCRLRKVKCDELKPSCARCTQSQKDCIYRDDLDLNFHHESNRVAIKAQQAWRSRAKHRYSLNESRNSRDPEEVTGSKRHLKTAHIPRSVLSEPVDEIALGRYIYDFCLEADASRSRPGHLDYLPHLYTNASTQSCLVAAVKAASLANLVNRSRAITARPTALRFYQVAIKQVNIALGDPTESLKDETLLACYLLGNFEVGHVAHTPT